MSYQYEYDFYDEVTDKTFQVEVELQNNWENYGADADGNRGQMMNFVEMESFLVFDNGILVTNKDIIRRAEKDYDRNHDESACQQCVDAYHENDNEPEYDEID